VNFNNQKEIFFYNFQSKLGRYNIDPEEIINVIDDSKYMDILFNMKEKMLTWYLETCDVVPFETDWRFRRR
jgi:hypothetical protein